MDFMTQLQAWLSRHPLKEPRESDQAGYTIEVMRRVRALGSPSSQAHPAHLSWLWGTTAELALVAAAAVLILVVTSSRRPTGGSLAQQVARELHLLGAVDESGLEALVPQSSAELAAELEAADILVLAESSASSDNTKWVEQTMQLLDQLDEDAPAGSEETPANDQDWLNELQWLDENDLSSSSS